MRYLLDTDICIYIAKRKPPAVLARLQGLRGGDVGMSVITYLELVYGAWKSKKVEANLGSIDLLRQLIPVQVLDANVAENFGRVRCDLEKRGLQIGSYDMLIAAHALALKLTLVTNNTREFARVNGLSVENWTLTS
jgi:tRNA(fMet)-specific endonuclease VapC